MTFGARLHAAMDGRGPLCAGHRPAPGAARRLGPDRLGHGLEQFALTAVEALAPEVAVVKPQSAFFERTAAGASRCSSGSSRPPARPAPWSPRREARRHRLDRAGVRRRLPRPHSPLAVDAITASPYLGFGALDPLVDTARRTARACSCSRLTSNPEAPAGAARAAPRRRHRRRHGPRPARRAERGVAPLGSFGAVVGATIGDTDEDLAINGPLLVPGHRRPGRHRRRRTPDLRRRAASAARQLREILAAGPDAARAARRRPPDERRLRRLGRSMRRPARLAGVVLALRSSPAGRVRRGPHRGLLQRPGSHQQGDRGRCSTRRRPTRCSSHLPMLRDLADKAPADLTDEWQTFLGALDGLQQALRTPGSNPSDFTAGKPPAGSRARRTGRDRRRRRPVADRGVVAGRRRHRAAGPRRLQDQPRPLDIRTLTAGRTVTRHSDVGLRMTTGPPRVAAGRTPWLDCR